MTGQFFRLLRDGLSAPAHRWKSSTGYLAGAGTAEPHDPMRHCYGKYLRPPAINAKLGIEVRVGSDAFVPMTPGSAPALGGSAGYQKVTMKALVRGVYR